MPNTDKDHEGLFVPARFVSKHVNEVDMNIGSMLFGATIILAVFSAAKGGKQCIASWNRTARVTPYMIMIWSEWVASIVLACLTWTYLRGYLAASFWTFFLMLLSWSLQIQFLLQIIINRIALLIMVQGRADRLKWGVGMGIAAVNVSVFCIWIPARLQISDRYIHINEIWDRMEKGIFALVDGGLSSYFIYLVRSKLIKNGLTKYNRLYRFNLVMIFLSLSLDVILIGLMSLRNNMVYLQFHPVAYLSKLYIEMNMAELIGKIVKASNPVTGLDRTLTRGEDSMQKIHSNDKGNRCSQYFSRERSHTSSEPGRTPSEPQHTAHVTVGQGSDIEMGGIYSQTDVEVIVSNRQNERGWDSSSRESVSGGNSIRQLQAAYGV